MVQCLSLQLTLENTVYSSMPIGIIIFPNPIEWRPMCVTEERQFSLRTMQWKIIFSRNWPSMPHIRSKDPQGSRRALWAFARPVSKRDRDGLSATCVLASSDAIRWRLMWLRWSKDIEGWVPWCFAGEPFRCRAHRAWNTKVTPAVLRATVDGPRCTRLFPCRLPKGKLHGS